MTDAHLEQDADDFADERVAVVGLAGRFPGSPNIDTLWQNLIDGVDCLTTFTTEELAELGIDESITSQDNFVPRGTLLDGYDRFDAERFGFSPREAAITDPQSRLLLETAHAALEHAGYDPFAAPGDVGVFAGCNPIDYATLLGQPDPTDSLTGFDQMIGNDRDFLATRISHRLGLTGPAFNVQTACSTSLVAIHLAAQHLLDYHCSMALAGGVSLNFRQGIGYFYQPGMILSPDGKCRAFDDNANGTTLGQGAGMVVLKRLADAIEDGDTIHAVIAASALNNDGDQKISYTAPSVEGQADVIATAHALAGLTGDDITYIEAHGTGTNLGDPVEVAALTKAFRLTTQRSGHCAIGSVKTNIGHTDAAAGVAGFIKAVLAVREGAIPKTLHFEAANKAIDFDSSPFFVAAETTEWAPTTTDLRRAGVSSFGIGGTNAHIIVEQPSEAAEPASAKHDEPTLLVASAPTENAALASARHLAEWATTRTVGPDEANTLVHGRRRYTHRAVTVTDPSAESVGPVRQQEVVEDGELVLMFSGQGAQFPGMASGLHGNLAAFTASLDDTVNRFRNEAGIDLAPLLLSSKDDDAAADRLRQTEVTQPALFAVQVAMTRQLASWGVKPAVVLGHSIGEFAAAVTAGILSLDDGVKAVAARGRLMQSMPTGSMLATRLTAAELTTHLPDSVELATFNSTRSTVAAGPDEAIAELKGRLEAAGHDGQVLATSHAFHSESMSEAAAAFADVLRGLTFRPPSVPMLSNVTGTWLSDEEAVDPNFWARQIRQPVRFADCLSAIADRPTVLCEVGPGRALSSFATQHEGFENTPATLQCLGHQRETRPGNVVALEAVGQLWAAGIEIDWEAVIGAPFERRRPTPPSTLVGIECWRPAYRHVLAMPEQGASVPAAGAAGLRRNPLDDWCFGRSWTRTALAASSSPQRVVIMVRDTPAHDEIVAQLKQQVPDVIAVKLGDATDLTSGTWTLAPGDQEGMSLLFKRLEGSSRRPDRVVLAWLDDNAHDPQDIELVRAQLDLGVNALLDIARSAASLSQERPVHVDVLTRGAHDVLGGEAVRPAAAAVAGPVKVIPLEYSGLSARQIDTPLDGSVDPATVVAALLSNAPLEQITALRGQSQWVHRVEGVPTSEGPTPLRRGGSYLILGGLGGVGLSIAEHLASNYGARLTLTSRSGEPTPDPEDAESMRRFERLAEVRAAAASVMTQRADVTSAQDLRDVIDTVLATHGDLDGVIMTAAVADNSGAIHRRSPEAAEAAISAKVHGAVLLADALRDRKLDFVMLSSSIASQLYHNRFGQVGYVTANSFAEAMSESHAFQAERVVTVAWDDWVDIGMSIRAAQNFASKHGDDISLMDEVHSFSPADGVQVFERALRPGPQTLFVSTTDLGDRVADDRNVISPFLAQALAGETDDADEGATVAEAVRSAWSGLLGIDDLNGTDDFFELGGDSLQVARMADRLSRSLEVDVPLDLIFDNAVLDQLVAAIESLTDGGSPSDDTIDGNDERTGLVALAPSQRRFFDRGSLHPHRFNVSVLLRPERSLTIAEVSEAFATLEDRHAALRTRFERGPHGWLQRVDPAGSPALTVGHHDLTSETDADRALEAIAADLQGGFDLEQRPLAEFALFELPNNEQRILVIIHHLVSDRVSLLQTIGELDQLLAGRTLRSATTPFSNWSAQSADFGRSPEALDLLERWNQIVPTSMATLPGNTAVENINRSATDVKRSLSVEGSAAILRAGDARADEIALLAVSDALNEWSGADLPVGIDVLGHGRRDLGTDVSRTAGFFLSYSPIWLPASSGVAELRRQLESAWTFDPIRFANPSATLHWTRPQVLFNYVGRPISADQPEVIEVVDGAKGSDTDPDNRRDHQLGVLVAIDDHDIVTITAVYNSLQLTKGHVEALLDLVVASIDRSIEGQRAAGN